MKVYVTDIIVQGLFGKYNHKINIPHSSDLKIIYGPNGVGKTKVLEIAKAVVSGNGEYLAQVPFKSATIVLSDSSEYRAFRTKNDSSANEELYFSYLGKDYSDPITEAHIDETQSFIKWVLDSTPWNKAPNNLWQNEKTNEVLTLDDLKKLYPAVHNNSKKRIQFNESLIYYVDAQRLSTKNKFLEDSTLNNRGIYFSLGSKDENQAIKSLSNIMRDMIWRAQRENSLISQRLERTFPARLIKNSDSRSESPENPQQNEQDIISRYKKQQEINNKITKILDSSRRQNLGQNLIKLPERGMHSWELNLLDLFLQDSDEKTKPFNYLLKKIGLFEEIITSRLNNKSCEVSGEKGINIFWKDNSKVNIPLESLSSGEQHEIILMFYLLFMVKENSLVLIDEPEISLHVAWQLRFIPDIEKISEITKSKFLISTHSPQIINGRNSIAQRLGDKNYSWDS
ncbi:AAA family ATPase [Rothia amarae]|uniref:AAA family ATPase n=1 Tax=Rothia amarae TaxID=169480 RepID=UPI0012458D38